MKDSSTSNNDASGDRIDGRVENQSSNKGLVVIHEGEKVELVGKVDWSRDNRGLRIESRDLRMRKISVNKVRKKAALKKERGLTIAVTLHLTAHSSLAKQHSSPQAKIRPSAYPN
jgi:hypothetical protein